jgi:trans-aconitate methyltransferase
MSGKTSYRKIVRLPTGGRSFIGGDDPGRVLMMDTSKPNRWDTALYDDKHSFVWKHGAALIEFLAPRTGERVLDLGCGTGHLTARIAEACAEVIGIDSSAEMIEEARRLYPGLTFGVADARDFRFDEPFDAVFSNAVLHWVKPPEQAVACVRRALKPGGRFVAEFGGRGNVAAIVAALDSAARAIGLGAWEHPWYFPSIGDYATLLERAGLEVASAALFDRPTPLEGEEGFRRWVEMFARDLVARVPAAGREPFFRHAEDAARPDLHRDGTWFADYRRLRVVARREDRPEAKSSQ